MQHPVTPISRATRRRAQYDATEVTARSIAVIGSGTMGRSIAAGMLRAGVAAADRLLVTDRTQADAEALARELGARAAPDNAAACAAADVVLLCVKPKDVANVLEELTTHHALAHRPLVISIAAGVTIATIEAALGPTAIVVRAMPNTPCLIGKGMTVLAKGSQATDEHLAVAQEIFSSLGRCIGLEEKHLNAVTAVSASGAAFLYVVIEALADGGVMCGLPRGVATELVAQTALGAAEMVLAAGRHPAALKDDVTTPGGCTIAGLLALEDGKLRSVLARAVEVTTRVAAGLGK
jgi:pyrroline-5-carboxylate reductase